MKRAVVTGGAGFIGSTLVDALLSKNVEVLAIDDLSTGNESNLHAARSHASCTFLQCSIVEPKAAEAVVQFKPDAVFHLAAQMNVRKSVEEPSFDATSNVVGTVSMLEAARLSGCSTFIFSSTGGAIYGEQDSFPADESHAIRPKSPYGVSKRCGELYLQYYGANAGMSTVALRFANVYGPRQNPKGEAGVVAIFAHKLLSGNPLTVTGDGEQTRDFVFVDEVVEACLLSARAAVELGFRAYNVGRGVETSINEIAQCFQRLAADDGLSVSDIVHVSALPGEQKRSVISSALLTKELGWRTEISLEQGLRSTLEFFKTQVT